MASKQPAAISSTKFEDRLQDGGYFRWLKVQFALMKVKEMVSEHVETISVQQHEEMHKSIHQNGQIETYSSETSKGKGNKRQKLCTITDAWKAEIEKQKVKFLNWKNGSSSLWETNHWEVAKVFMGPYQQSSTNAASCDPTGILQFMVNCKAFKYDKAICDKIAKVITVRNRIMHHPTQKLEERDFEQCITSCIDVINTKVVPKKSIVEITAVVSELNAVKDLGYDGNPGDIRYLKNVETAVIKAELRQLSAQSKEGREEIREGLESLKSLVERAGDLHPLLVELCGDMKSTKKQNEEIKSMLSGVQSDVRRLLDKDSERNLPEEITAIQEHLQEEYRSPRWRDINRLPATDSKLNIGNDKLIWPLNLKAKQIDMEDIAVKEESGKRFPHIFPKYKDIPCSSENTNVFKIKQIHEGAIIEESEIYASIIHEEAVTLTPKQIGHNEIRISADVGLECDTGQAGASNMEETEDKNDNMLNLLQKSNIFEKGPSRVLEIVGQAGMGKSVLSKRIVIEWCNGKHKQYDLVFHIPLRTAKADQTNILDYLEEMKLVLKENRESLEHFLDRPEKCHNVLFILDGVDEVDLNKLIPVKKLLVGDIYKNSSKVLTMRQTGMAKPYIATIRVELAGLSNTCVKNIIEATVLEKLGGRQEHLDKFIEKIEQQKFYFIYLKVPLYLRFVCTIFTSQLSEFPDLEKLEVPETTTALFNAFFRVILKTWLSRPGKDGRHYEENSHNFEKNPISSHSSVPVEIRRILKCLARMSFDDLRQNKSYVFDSEMVKKYDMRMIELIDSGFMTTDLDYSSKSNDDNPLFFAHKTLQEYMAALHLTEDQNQISKFFNKYTLSQNTIEEIRLPLQFACGLSEEFFDTLLHTVEQRFPFFKLFIELLDTLEILFSCCQEIRSTWNTKGDKLQTKMKSYILTTKVAQNLFGNDYIWHTYEDEFQELKPIFELLDENEKNIILQNWFSLKIQTDACNFTGLSIPSVSLKCQVFPPFSIKVLNCLKVPSLTNDNNIVHSIETDDYSTIFKNQDGSKWAQNPLVVRLQIRYKTELALKIQTESQYLSESCEHYQYICVKPQHQTCNFYPNFPFVSALSKYSRCQCLTEDLVDASKAIILYYKHIEPGIRKVLLRFPSKSRFNEELLQSLLKTLQQCDVDTLKMKVEYIKPTLFNELAFRKLMDRMDEKRQESELISDAMITELRRLQMTDGELKYKYDLVMHESDTSRDKRLNFIIEEALSLLEDRNKRQKSSSLNLGRINLAKSLILERVHLRVALKQKRDKKQTTFYFQRKDHFDSNTIRDVLQAIKTLSE